MAATLPNLPQEIRLAISKELRRARDFQALVSLSLTCHELHGSADHALYSSLNIYHIKDMKRLVFTSGSGPESDSVNKRSVSLLTTLSTSLRLASLVQEFAYHVHLGVEKTPGYWDLVESVFGALTNLRRLSISTHSDITPPPDASQPFRLARFQLEELAWGGDGQTLVHLLSTQAQLRRLMILSEWDGERVTEEPVAIEDALEKIFGYLFAFPRDTFPV